MQKFKVRIAKCSTAGAWYEYMVGKIIEVTDKDAADLYQYDAGKVYNIPKSECEVVSAPH